MMDELCFFPKTCFLPRRVMHIGPMALNLENEANRIKLNMKTNNLFQVLSLTVYPTFSISNNAQSIENTHPFEYLADVPPADGSNEVDPARHCSIAFAILTKIW